MCREFSICVLPQRINIYMYHYILSTELDHWVTGDMLEN